MDKAYPIDTTSYTASAIRHSLRSTPGEHPPKEATVTMKKGETLAATGRPRSLNTPGAATSELVIVVVVRNYTAGSIATAHSICIKLVTSRE